MRRVVRIFYFYPWPNDVNAMGRFAGYYGVQCVIKPLSILVICALAFELHGQKQLVVLMHGNTVVARYQEGSSLRCVLKNGDRKEGRIVSLTDFSMITTRDTIHFESLAKIDRRGYYRVNIMRDVGYVLLLGGLVYFGVDQLNNSLGYDKHSFDSADRNALIAAGIGAGMLFIKSPYRRMNKKMQIRTVAPGSAYHLASQ